MEAGIAIKAKGQVGRSDRRDGRGGRRAIFRRGIDGAGTERLPHLRLLLRNVHRQLHELPLRGPRPGAARNGTLVATHADRKHLFVEAGHLIVDLARRFYEKNDEAALPRAIASFESFENAMTLDMAMGGRPTPCCICSPPRMRPRSTSPWPTSTGSRAACRCLQGRALGRRRPCRGRASRGRNRRHPGRTRPRGLLNRDVTMVIRNRSSTRFRATTSTLDQHRDARILRRRAGRRADAGSLLPERALERLDEDREDGVIRDAGTPSPRTAVWPALRQSRADGCLVKTAGVTRAILNFGPGHDLRRPGLRGARHSQRRGGGGRRGGIRYEGPRGGPGMQEMLSPHHAT